MNENKPTIICRNCYSGFEIDPAAGDLYCGFCGSSLKELEISFYDEDDRSQPYYIDEIGPIKVKLRLKNAGYLGIATGKLDVRL